MVGDVADASDGNLGIVCLNGHTASVGMDDSGDSVHIGIVGKNLTPDLVHCIADHSGHALDRCHYTQDVPASCRKVGSVVIAHPCPAPGKVGQNSTLSACLEFTYGRRFGKFDIELVDPSACLDILEGIAEGNAVADYGLSLIDFAQSDFVPLGNIRKGTNSEAFDRLAFLRGSNHNGYVVML